MLNIQISELAELDLGRIYRYGKLAFGENQADKFANDLFDVFELLAINPMMGPERFEFKSLVRIHIHNAHAIVYRLFENEIIIVRILSARQNLPDHI